MYMYVPKKVESYFEKQIIHYEFKTDEEDKFLYSEAAYDDRRAMKISPKQARKRKSKGKKEKGKGKKKESNEAMMKKCIIDTLGDLMKKTKKDKFAESSSNESSSPTPKKRAKKPKSKRKAGK